MHSHVNDIAEQKKNATERMLNAYNIHHRANNKFIYCSFGRPHCGGRAKLNASSSVARPCTISENSFIAELARGTCILIAIKWNAKRSCESTQIGDRPPTSAFDERCHAVDGCPCGCAQALYRTDG